MSSFINFNNKEITTGANYSAEVIKIALLKSETKSSPKAEMLVKNVKEPVSLNEALVFFTDKLSAMKSLSNAIIEVNEGRVKQFEMDYASMVKDIKKGYGWIDPEYVADTWENSSDSIGFDLVRDEIFDRLIAAGLLAHADSNNPEKAGKYIKSAKDLYVMESEEVNETLFYAFFNNKKIEVEGKDLWDAKQKAIIKLKVPKSKVGLLAVVSAESQKNQDFRFESVVTEGKSAGLSKEETLKVAQKFADALAKVDGVKVTVSKGHEEDSFDLDYDGEEFAGGSYNIYKNGDVVNMAVPNYAVYGKMDDDIKTIIKNINKVSNESTANSAVTERRSGQNSDDALILIQQALQGMKNMTAKIKGDTVIISNKAKDEFTYSLNDGGDVQEFIDELEESVVTEAKNDGNLDTIADYVQQVLDDGKSFMDIGKKLKGAYTYDFSTGMMPMYIIPVSGNKIVIINKKYVENGQADRVVGDIAIGLMESVNEQSDDALILIQQALKGMKNMKVDIKGDTVIVSNKAKDEFTYSMNDGGDVQEFIDELEESVVTEADNTEILDLVDHIHEIIKDLKEDSTKDSKKTSKLFNDSKPLIARLHSLVEGLTNEAFYRMSSVAIGNELYAASQALTTYYDWLQAGNDSGEGKSLDHIIDLLKKCKNNIKKFNKAAEVKGTAYESLEVNEGRSINKIQKEWSQTTTDMQQKVVDWKEAEGDRKIEILEELKSLTAKKKQLESELESVVAGKDKDVQLAISEDHSADPNDVYEVKPCAIEGTPWSVWEGDVRVECFATKEEAQAFADKQNKEQGLADVEEGNAFGAARAEAIAKGEKEFEVDGETFKVEDVDKEDKENAEEFVEEATVTEAKFDKKSLMKAMKKDDGFIQLGNGQEYIIYAYDNGNDDNDAMWGDKTIFALDQDGEEHEIKYSDIVSYNESIKPSWDNLLEEFEMVEITNEDLRTEIKKFIKKNNEELDEFADNDNWDAMYQKLYDEFGVEADSAKGKDLLKTFQFIY